MFDSLPIGIAELCKSIYPNTCFTATLLRQEKYEEIPVRLEQWLHPDELQQFAGYRFEKRQREWLSGRLCSKKVLRTFLKKQSTETSAPPHFQVRIASKESGQP
jgi:CHAD domain-containing protein